MLLLFKHIDKLFSLPENRQGRRGKEKRRTREGREKKRRERKTKRKRETGRIKNGSVKKKRTKTVGTWIHTVLQKTGAVRETERKTRRKIRRERESTGSATMRLQRMVMIILTRTRKRILRSLGGIAGTAKNPARFGLFNRLLFAALF